MPTDAVDWEDFVVGGLRLSCSCGRKWLNLSLLNTRLEVLSHLALIIHFRGRVFTHANRCYKCQSKQPTIIGTLLLHDVNKLELDLLALALH